MAELPSDNLLFLPAPTLPLAQPKWLKERRDCLAVKQGHCTAWDRHAIDLNLHR